MRPTCFLHIGKTGGTALHEVVDRHLAAFPDAPIEFFTHDTTLLEALEVRRGAQIVFFIRDPLSRFVSGFNSRLRMGLPRYHSIWTPAEEEAFSRFRTPNELAEALGSIDQEEMKAAEAAMQAVRHIRLNLRHFLHSVDVLEAHVDDIAFIGAQEHFDADLVELKRLLQIDAAIMPPTDDLGAHRNPKDMPRLLSPRGRANLQAWFRDDFLIYAWCLHRRSALIEALRTRNGQNG